MSTAETEHIPGIIGAGRVVLYSRIDERHELTGAGWQMLHGEPALRSAWGVAITECIDRDGFFLLSCEEDWMPVAEAWYPSLEDAKCQAEFEYEGLGATWQVPAS